MYLCPFQLLFSIISKLIYLILLVLVRWSFCRVTLLLTGGTQCLSICQNHCLSSFICIERIRPHCIMFEQYGSSWFQITSWWFSACCFQLLFSKVNTVVSQQKGAILNKEKWLDPIPLWYSPHAVFASVRFFFAVGFDRKISWLAHYQAVSQGLSADSNLGSPGFQFFALTTQPRSRVVWKCV